MHIEITAQDALEVITPLSVAVNEALPAGPLHLVPESGTLEHGAPWPIQGDGGGMVTLCPPLRAGETVRLKVESAPPTPPSPGVTISESYGALTIALPGGEFGVYHFDDGAPRPYLWPLRGPGGKEVTRAFPMEQRAGEQHDHPHHRSLWTGFDEVNGVNNWHEQGAYGVTRHGEFLWCHGGPVFGDFLALNYWQDPDGKPFLSEQRRLRVYNVDGDFRLFDYGIIWHAEFGDVSFGDTKEAGVIALRMATSMDGARGGVIVNSEGGRGEKECWGQRAAWCDYSGPVDGEVLGIAVFSDPENFAQPPRWHVRDYGLFTANPFSNGSFTGGEKTPFVLKDWDMVNFDFRVMLHRDNVPPGAMWNAFSAPPKVVVG